MTLTRLLDNSRKHPIWTLLAGLVAGAIAGAVVYYLTHLSGIYSFLIAGAAVGLVVGSIATLTSGEVQSTEIQFGTAAFGQATFQIDDKTRAVAWQLFVETMTRVTTQPLGSEEGFLREALNSIHTLFGTARGLLKEMSPTQVKEGTSTVEMVAMTMLNEELRPFLSKWHPLLTSFERQSCDASDRDWEKNDEFRSELASLRQQLIKYAHDFGKLANVSQLDELITRTTSRGL